jgi:transposase
VSVLRGAVLIADRVADGKTILCRAIGRRRAVGAGRAADPKLRRARRGRTGRPRIPDRAALAGILSVLKTGISWNELPRELGCGSGVTCWRQLREWQQAGVWQLHRVVLDQLVHLDLLDWSRAAVDSVSVRAKRRGEAGGPSPTGEKPAASITCCVAARAPAARPDHRREHPRQPHAGAVCWTPTPAPDETVFYIEQVFYATEVSGRQASHSNARSASSRSKWCGSNGPPAHSSRSSCSGCEGLLSAAWNSS